MGARGGMGLGEAGEWGSGIAFVEEDGVDDEAAEDGQDPQHAADAAGGEERRFAHIGNEQQRKHRSGNVKALTVAGKVKSNKEKGKSNAAQDSRLAQHHRRQHALLNRRRENQAVTLPIQFLMFPGNLEAAPEHRITHDQLFMSFFDHSCTREEMWATAREKVGAEGLTFGAKWEGGNCGEKLARKV